MITKGINTVARYIICIQIDNLVLYIYHVW